MNFRVLLATSICQTLFEAGYVSYFAGGWVRDLLLAGISQKCSEKISEECEREPLSEEIDIATSAPPEIIQKLFPHTIPVGIAFGVVIALLEGHPFEISTFRKDHPYQDGRHPSGVDFSTPEKDALRRDFTINGMFYDPLSETIYDYVGGEEDLKRGVIRAIGNPEERFKEDRLRMIRAARFSARFGFPIEKKTKEAIQAQASTLFPAVSMERIWQEFNKMAAKPHFDQALLLLKELGLLETIFPQLRDVDIGKKVLSFPYFPLQCPAILYLLELFPNSGLEARLALCDYLKTSNRDKKLVTFFTESNHLFDQPGTEAQSWAKFYANPASSLVLAVRAAKIYPPERVLFLDEHEARKTRLSNHIARIQERRPLITAAMLEKEGIKPGKKMGFLLKQGEAIGINENIEDPALLIQRLKEFPIWD